MLSRLFFTVIVLGLVLTFSGSAFSHIGLKEGLNPVSTVNPNAPLSGNIEDARPTPASFKKPEDVQLFEVQMPGVAPTPPSNYFCDFQHYYDDTTTSVWVWSIPDAWGDDLFNMRFTVEVDVECTLKVGWILMYGGWTTGTPDMRIYLWDDDGFGFPYNKLDSVDVPSADLPTDFGWVAADWAAANWVFAEGEEYHIGWTTLGGDGDTLWCVSDKATGPYVGQYRSSEKWAGFWGFMADDWPSAGDIAFFMESERCCYEIPYSDCYSQRWDEGTAYYWRAPHPDYNIIDYAQRFTANRVESLASVDICVYDMGSTPPDVSGNDDLIIKVWDDDGFGYPGTVLATEIVPAGSYPFFPSYTTVDFYSHGLIFNGEDFFISFNSSGVFPNDCEATLSDDETTPHGRSYCMYGGNWSTLGDVFGMDVDMKFVVNLCIDPMYNCYTQEFYTTPEYYWQLPDSYGDIAHAQKIRRYYPDVDCRVEEVSWAFYLPAADSLNSPYSHNSRVSIYSDVGGLPGAELASIILTPADYVMYPGWTTVDFGPQNIIVPEYYWIAIESFAPTPEEGIRTMTDFGGGGMNYGGAELWNGTWSWLCNDWSGVPCDIAFVAKARQCCEQPPPPSWCSDTPEDEEWPTHQGNQQRTGRSLVGFSDAQCDLTVLWSYVHPTNCIWFTGPAIANHKIACAWDNEVRVFNITNGLLQYTVSGFPLGNQIRCTPHITTIDIGGTPTQVMYLTGGDQQSVSCWDFQTGALIWSRDITTTGPSGLFGQTRYCSFITLDIAGTEVLFWGTDDGAIVAAEAATGNLYAGWTNNPVNIGQPIGKSGATDGTSLFYNSFSGSVEGDVWSIDAATGAINWQLSATDGLQANNVFPQGPQLGEGFPGGCTEQWGMLYVNSDIATPYHPGDGVLYAINTYNGSLNYAVPSVGARGQSAGGTPIVDEESGLYVIGESGWVNTYYGGRVLAFRKHSGAAEWSFDSPEYDNYWGDAVLSCEVDWTPDRLFVAGHHGFIDCLDADNGESIFRRRVSFGSYPNSVALSFAVGHSRIAMSDFYGGLYVLGKGADRPRLEIQSYRPTVPVEFGAATSLHVPLSDLLTNTGCAPLTINDITIDENPTHPFIPDFSAHTVRPNVMDRAASVADKLIQGFTGKALVMKMEPSIDEYYVARDRGHRTMNLGANVIPDFIQTATYPDGIVSPPDGGIISPGDTVDVVIDVNQSLISRGPQYFYMTIDSDDPDFFLHQDCVLPYGPPEVYVTIVGGCLFDTTLLYFGMGAANIHNVTNTGRIATGEDWMDPWGMDIDGDNESIYQGSFIYATGVYEQAINTQVWHSGGEDETYISLQPDPNWCDNECHAHLDENVTLSCLGGYSENGVTYTPIMGNRVCKSYIDSVQNFGDPWDWENFGSPFDSALTMGLYVNTRTVGAVDFAPLKDLTIEVFEVTERNGDSVTGWKFGATMDYDVGGDIAAWDPEGSAAWVSSGSTGDVAWGMMKLPFGCGCNEATGNNNPNVDYDPLINSVQMYGYGAWWGDIYLGDTAWKYLNMPPGVYSQDPSVGGDEEAHFTICAHDFAGGDTYEFAVVQFGLHGITGGSSAEIVALGKLANKWIGFGRSDVNNDGETDLADIMHLACFVNGMGPGPIPFMHLGDVDCDGDVDMDDVLYLIEWYFDDGPCPCGDWCF